MKEPTVPPEFARILSSITKKRARTVIEHILAHGSITTEDLKSKYGYDHPPRSARDVREEGIPLETFRVKNSEGRSIAAYRFGDLTKIRRDRVGGRRTFSKEFKESLAKISTGRCYICLEEYEDRYLQIDHRVPYEVAGDAIPSKRDPNEYMLLCGSCNRAKSWSCEHCLNWTRIRSQQNCKFCYWATPESYKHIAMEQIRRLDVVWKGEEVEVYEKFKLQARNAKTEIPVYVKSLIRKAIQNFGKG